MRRNCWANCNSIISPELFCYEKQTYLQAGYGIVRDPYFLFQLSNCFMRRSGGNEAVGSSSPGSKGSSGSASAATLNCADSICPTVTFAVKYDSTRGPGPKLKIYEGTTGSTIPAGTHLRLVVPFETDSASH